MYHGIIAAALSGFALVNAQNPPAPTPSNAVIIEGDASYDGPVIPGTTGKLGDAIAVSGNPAGAVYKATLPDKDTSDVRGYITASTAPNGVGVSFSLSFAGLPDADLGPFLYHIHEAPVPADGNCTKTMAHLDPYVRGAIPPCDNTKPATCQVGDLAGKHGNITSDPFKASYIDAYVSLTPGNKASLVGKSIVIHSANTTRLNCANFELVSGGNATSNSTNTTVSPSSTPVPFVPGGAAATNMVSGVAVIAGLVGMAALLL